MNAIILNFPLKTLKLIHAKGGIFKIAKLTIMQLIIKVLSQDVCLAYIE